MSDSNLLDLIIQATEKANETEKQTGVPARVPSRHVPDPRLAPLAEKIDRDRHAAQVAAEREAWAEAERRAVEKAAELPPEMCGFTAGTKFEVRKCGEEVNGVWVVQRVEPGPAGDQSRSLWAVRASGDPGTLRFGERKLLDALHAGLVIRQDD
jgi:hypothetical protein